MKKIVVMMLAACATTLTYPCRLVSQEPQRVSLPTSLFHYHEYNGSAVTSGYRSIYVRWHGDSLFRTIPLPFDTLLRNNDFVVRSTHLSHDGEYVIANTYGGDGIYRYSRTTARWLSIVPPDAGREISALTIAPNGDLYIGTGGHHTSPASSARGIFVSTDNGDSWSSVPFDFSDGLLSPGIIEISVNNRGFIAFLGRSHAGTAPTGVYIQPFGKQVKYYNVCCLIHLHCLDSALYAADPNRGILYWELLNDSLADYKRLQSPKPLSIRGLVHWSGDTVMAYTPVPPTNSADPVYDTLLFIAENSIVRTIIVPHVHNTRIRPNYAVHSSAQNGVQLVVLGAGTTSVLDTWSGSVTPLNFDVPHYSIEAVVYLKEAMLVRVARHGWYKVFPDGTSSYIGFESDRVAQSIFGQTSFPPFVPPVFVHRTHIVNISSNQPDTLFSNALLQNAQSVTCAKKTCYARTGSRTIVRFHEGQTTPDTLPMTGWPLYENNGNQILLLVSELWMMNDTLYAWADQNAAPLDQYEQGGIYAFNGISWQRADNGFFGSATSLMFVTSNDTQALICGAERASNGQVTHSRMADFRGSNAIAAVGNEHSLNPSVPVGGFATNGWWWCTQYGTLWFQTREGVLTSTEDYGVVVGAVPVNNRLIVATQNNGVWVIPDPTSSISLVVQQQTAGGALHVWPVPADRSRTIDVRVANCQHDHHSVFVTDVLGRRQNVDFELIGASCRVNLGHVSNGRYLLSVQGTACTHTAVIAVQ